MTCSRFFICVGLRSSSRCSSWASVMRCCVSRRNCRMSSSEYRPTPVGGPKASPVMLRPSGETTCGVHAGAALAPAFARSGRCPVDPAAWFPFRPWLPRLALFARVPGLAVRLELLAAHPGPGRPSRPWRFPWRPPARCCIDSRPSASWRALLTASSSFPSGLCPRLPFADSSWRAKSSRLPRINSSRPFMGS